MVKKPQPEIDALHDIIERLLQKYPRLMVYALDEFKEYYSLSKIGLKNPFINQLFLGWIFTAHFLYDGKTIIQLARQTLKLNSAEQQILNSVENAIIGYFEITKHKNKDVKLIDMFTEKKYLVRTIDLDYKFKKGDVIEAKLVRRFDGELFFFGGFILRTPEKKDILHDLKTYRGQK